jgi:hypothetical protein
MVSVRVSQTTGFELEPLPKRLPPEFLMDEYFDQLGDKFYAMYLCGKASLKGHFNIIDTQTD